MYAGQQVLKYITMHSKRIYHNDKNLFKEGRKKVKNVNEQLENNVPVNCVTWNQCPKFAHQFVTADENSKVTLWDGATGKPIACDNSSLELVTCAIEPSQGQMLLAAGIDDKISLFDINKAASRKERTKQI